MKTNSDNISLKLLSKILHPNECLTVAVNLCPYPSNIVMIILSVCLVFDVQLGDKVVEYSFKDRQMG